MATAQEIQQLFATSGASPFTGALLGETPQQRYTRIANEINSGTRTLAQVTTSIQRLASSPASYTIGDPTTVPLTGAEEADEFNAAGAATIKSLLSSYGLDELVPQVDGWVRQGLSWAEIEVQLRDPSTASGKVVDRLYPEIQLRRKANLQPMSIGDIQDYRTNAMQLMRAAGMPPGFYDSPEDIQALIVGDTSPIELRDRIGEYEAFGAQIAAGAGAELDLFKRAYGIEPTAMQLAALVLNPDKALPSLRRQFSAVKIDVGAGRAGFGDLSQTEAERLADVGVTQEQANQGFSQLVQSRELFSALPGQGAAEDDITRTEQFGAAFENNAQAQRKIMNRAERRKAAFGGGGAFSEDKAGFSGIGTAR